MFESHTNYGKHFTIWATKVCCHLRITEICAVDLAPLAQIFEISMKDPERRTARVIGDVVDKTLAILWLGQTPSLSVMS